MVGGLISSLFNGRPHNQLIGVTGMEIELVSKKVEWVPTAVP
jgi:hypothetical protein